VDIGAARSNGRTLNHRHPETGFSRVKDLAPIFTDALSGYPGPLRFSPSCATIFRRTGGNLMQKRLLAILICVLALSLSSFAASKSKKKPASGAPDKAYLEKLMAGWSSGNAANMAQYYDQGEYTFFDIAPLKYNNWAEYQKGVTELIKNYKSVKLTVNDDAQIHTDGNLTWSTATVKEDAVTTAGKVEMATWRWTIIFEKQGGKWMIVHEHTSAPLP
jgi:ketosteroid isomerase-like protein